MVAELDLPHLKSWIGKSHSALDTITPRLASSLAAILDEQTVFADGDLAPLGIHWCLSPDIAPMSELGPDGHPARGHFLPPVPLSRRMWAGSDLHFRGVFRVGDTIERCSVVKNIDVKEGRSGTLCFVTVAHKYRSSDGLLLSEEHDIVYRDIAPTVLPPAPVERERGEISREIEATPTLLARYSSLTDNGHRIHYDRDYAQNIEMYHGLIVHGPLQATYLLRLAQNMPGGDAPNHFKFRGRAPLFDKQVFSLNARREDGNKLSLWVASADGIISLSATAVVSL